MTREEALAIQIWSRTIRSMSNSELYRMMRELWKKDPLAYGNLRKAIDDVGREEVNRAKENWQEP